MNWYLLVVWILAISGSCGDLSNGDKGQSDEPKVDVVELSYGDTLRYDLGFFGDEEGAQLIKIPRYNAFEGFCSDGYEPLIYCYAATIRFEGGDTVIIKASRGSDGSSPNTNHEIHKLIIKLTQK